MKLFQKADSIPENLDECFKFFLKNFTKEELDQYKSAPEDESFMLHSGVGRWIRNTWGLWTGSELSKFFNEMGITHADDMSGIIFTSFHRYLNDKDLSLEEQVKYYKDYWKNSDNKSP